MLVLQTEGITNFKIAQRKVEQVHNEASGEKNRHSWKSRKDFAKSAFESRLKINLQ